MAQAITNTVQTNPFAKLIGGLQSPKINLPKIGPQPNMSTVNGPKYAPPPTMGVLSAPKATPKAQPTWEQTLKTTQDNYFNNNPSVARPNTSGNLPPQNTYVQPANNGGYVSNYIPTPPPEVKPAPTPTPQQPQQVRGLFPDVLSSLAYSSGARNTELADRAQKIANDAGQRIADVGGEGARFQAGQLTTGTSPVAEGNAAITAQTTAAQQRAIAEGAQVALTGNAQGLTAQNQTQSALGTAASYAAPQVAQYGQTSFDPVTGEFNGGGSMPPEVMQQYAQMAASGQYSAIPSFITSNPVLNAQLNVAAQALNPKYTPVGAAGASTVLQNIPALRSAETAAEGIKNTVTNYLQANPSLNPSDLAAGNLLQQWIQGKQLTDPKYQILFNYLDEYTNTLAPILGVGGNPTNLKTQIAQGFVNAAASGQSITQVLSAISELAKNKIVDMESGALGGGTVVQQNSGGGGGFAETW